MIDKGRNQQHDHAGKQAAPRLGGQDHHHQSKTQEHPQRPQRRMGHPRRTCRRGACSSFLLAQQKIEPDRNQHRQQVGQMVAVVESAVDPARKIRTEIERTTARPAPIAARPARPARRRPGSAGPAVFRSTSWRSVNAARNTAVSGSADHIAAQVASGCRLSGSADGSAGARAGQRVEVFLMAGQGSTRRVRRSESAATATSRSATSRPDRPATTTRAAACRGFRAMASTAERRSPAAGSQPKALPRQR